MIESNQLREHFVEECVIVEMYQGSVRTTYTYTQYESNSSTAALSGSQKYATTFQTSII